MWSPSEITQLVTDLKLPDRWIPGKSQASFRLLLEIINEVEHQSFTLKARIPAILKAMVPCYEITNLGSFVRKIRTRRVSKLDDIYHLEIVGPVCKTAGITADWLNDPEASSNLKGVRITIAMICELNEYRITNQRSWKDTHNWICRMFGLSDLDGPGIVNIMKQVMSIVDNKSRLVRAKNEEKLREFLGQEYKLSSSRKDIQDKAVVREAVTSHVDQGNSKLLQSLAFKNPGKKVAEFANFIPEQSEREKRKLRRLQEEEHQKHLQSRTMYDANGHLTSNGQDLCDCLGKDCPGCHYPCKQCGSVKCGPICRCKRKWVFDQIEDEGHNYMVKF